MEARQPHTRMLAVTRAKPIGESHDDIAGLDYRVLAVQI